MVQIVNYEDSFCLKRRIIRYKGRDFCLVAGKDYSFDEKNCVLCSAFLVSEKMIYSIPAENGVFEVFDIIFLINERGVFFEII